VVTRQLQVERRTGKVHRTKTDVLPQYHANATKVTVTKEIEIREKEVERGKEEGPK